MAGGAEFFDAALDHVVDETAIDGFVATDVTAARHHLERLRDADETWEPLGSAGAREQAEVDFWQAELGRGDRHAVVRTQRDLESATEGRCRGSRR